MDCTCSPNNLKAVQATVKLQRESRAEKGLSEGCILHDFAKWTLMEMPKNKMQSNTTKLVSVRDEIVVVEVNEDELGLTVTEEDEDGVGVETGIDNTDHWDSKVELVHDGAVEGHEGDGIATLNPEKGHGGSQLHR
ncbi:hypothetical protein U1Q18_018821 [Sarracenia purpurea var. burkii]